MGGRLQGKNIIVTGAGRGIGRAYAHAMTREGAQVVVNDVSEDHADAVVEEIRRAGGVSRADNSDISDFDAVGDMVDRNERELGELHALVNNAALEFRCDLIDHTWEDWEMVMSVNARGSFNGAHHAARVMMPRGQGTIVNTCSGAFWRASESVAAYSASKAAVFSLTLSLDAELSRFGITCNCISPHATRTRMVDDWMNQLSSTSDASEEDLLREWRIQRPENLAPAAVYLCSDAARSVSGRIFEVWDDKISIVHPPRTGDEIQRAGEQWDFETLASALPKLH